MSHRLAEDSKLCPTVLRARTALPWGQESGITCELYQIAATVQGTGAETAKLCGVVVLVDLVVHA